MEKNLKTDFIYIYIYIFFLNHFAVRQKLTQYCKSTILNEKEERKKRKKEIFIYGKMFTIF